MLTTVVSSDPMYVYFDMDERTLLQIRRAINAGRLKPPDGGEFPVSFGLQGESSFPHQGTVDFLDNRLDVDTGTITLRAVVKNPKPPAGIRLMSPGMFARVRLPLGQPHAALLVIDGAIGIDQGLKYIYVLDANDTVEYRRVEIGPSGGGRWPASNQLGAEAERPSCRRRDFENPAAIENSTQRGSDADDRSNEATRGRRVKHAGVALASAVGQWERREEGCLSQQVCHDR